MPVLTGRKTDSERFAGALRTYSCEALMQDNKALQAGTSHNLGQNFARAFEVRFQSQEGQGWTTSGTRRGACPPGWSARLIMTHGDDTGLICPPRLAQYQVVIVPIYKTDDERAAMLEAADKVKAELVTVGHPGPPRCARGHQAGRQVLRMGRAGRPAPARARAARRGGRHRHARAAHRWREGSPADRGHRPAHGAGGRADAARPARHRDPPPRAQQLPRTRRASRRSSTTSRTAAASCTPAGAATRRCEAEIKEQTKATIRVLPDEEFRSPEAPTTCIWSRPAGRRRGGVGEGVLTVAAGPGHRRRAGPGAPARGRGLARRDGALLDGGVSLARVAAEFGTPAYVYNADVIRRQFRELDEALAAVPHRICFAVKANSNLAVLRVLRDLGAGADIVSGGEMARALAAGFSSDRIVFSGVGKREDELARGDRGRHRARQRRVDGGAGAAGAARRGCRRRRCRSASGSIPTSRPRPTRTSPPGKRGIKFGVPLDQVRPAAAMIRQHPAARAGGHRDAHRQPAPRHAALRGGRRPAGRAGGRGARRRHDDPPRARHGRRARHPLPRRAADVATALRGGAGAAGEADRAHARTSSRAASWSAALGRAPHQGAFQEALGREGIRHRGRRDERPGAAQPLPGVPRDHPGGAAAPGRRCVADVVGPVCETGDFLALDRELAPWSRATCSPCSAPAPTASSWPRTTTRGRCRPR